MSSAGAAGADAARRSAGGASDAGEEGSSAGGPAARIPAAERRSAALALIGIWRDVARDLALVAMGDAAAVRGIDLLDDLEAASRTLPGTFAPDQLRRLDVAGERLEGNVSPELVIDALALGWAARVAA